MEPGLLPGSGRRSMKAPRYSPASAKTRLRGGRRLESGAREVVGHLIDSACNNQRRFIINQHAEQLTVDPYDQDAWVSLSHYAETPVAVLVPAWRAYNIQIATIIEHVPDEVLVRPRGPIGNYRFGYLEYQTSGSATLRDLAEDYVGHIHHHFKQIRALMRVG
jgi:hypothetical protein